MTQNNPRRVWCCGTPVGGPHTPGCRFEPREDNPIDYANLFAAGPAPLSTLPAEGMTAGTRVDLLHADLVARIASIRAGWDTLMGIVGVPADEAGFAELAMWIHRVMIHTITGAATELEYFTEAGHA